VRHNPQRLDGLADVRTNKEQRVAKKAKRRAMAGKDAEAVEDEAAPDALDNAVEQAIAACEGDLRGTIRALVVSNNFLAEQNMALSQEIDFAWRWVSPGFTRSKLKRRMNSVEPE
jgi:hypothetical protein